MQNFDTVQSALGTLSSNPSDAAAYASGTLDHGTRLSQDVLEMPGAGPGGVRQGLPAINRELTKCTKKLVELQVIVANADVPGTVDKVVRRVLVDKLQEYLCTLHDAHRRYIALELEARPVKDGGAVGSAAAKNDAKQKKKQTKKLLQAAISKYNTFIEGLTKFNGFENVVKCPQMSFVLDAKDPQPLPSLEGGQSATATHATQLRLHHAWCKLRCVRQHPTYALNTVRSFTAAYRARGDACLIMAAALVRAGGITPVPEPAQIEVPYVGSVTRGSALGWAVSHMLEAAATECQARVQSASNVALKLSDLVEPPPAPKVAANPIWTAARIDDCRQSVGCVPLHVAITERFAAGFPSPAARTRAESLASDHGLGLYWTSSADDGRGLMMAVAACLVAADANADELTEPARRVVQSKTMQDRAAALVAAVNGADGIEADIEGSCDTWKLLAAAAEHLGLQIHVFCEIKEGGEVIFKGKIHGAEESDVVLTVARVNDSWLPMIDASWYLESPDSDSDVGEDD